MMLRQPPCRRQLSQLSQISETVKSSAITNTNGAAMDRRLAGLAPLIAQQPIWPVDPSSAKRCCQRQTIGRLTATSVTTRCTGRRSTEATTARTHSIYLLVAIRRDPAGPQINGHASR